MVEHKELHVRARHRRNGSVCRKFSPNSKSYKYIHIIKNKERERERDAANVLKLKIETLGLQKQGPVFALATYF